MYRNAWRAGLLAVCALALIAARQDGKPDFAAEFKSMKSAYQAEYKTFFEPYTKFKTDEERMKFDWSKAPATDYVPKFKDLAVRAKGSDMASQILVEVWNLSLFAGISDLESAKWAANELITNHPGSEVVANLAGQLAWSYPFEHAEAQKMLRAILAAPPHPKVKASIQMALAQNIMRGENPRPSEKAEARKLLETVQKESDPVTGSNAKGMLFELDNLQIGMKAPDFETVDENGKKWKLSDYRGKVVVVDFWGFW
jgi:hypothetical protein